MKGSHVGEEIDIGASGGQQDRVPPALTEMLWEKSRLPSALRQAALESTRVPPALAQTVLETKGVISAISRALSEQASASSSSALRAAMGTSMVPSTLMQAAMATNSVPSALAQASLAAHTNSVSSVLARASLDALGTSWAPSAISHALSSGFGGAPSAIARAALEKDWVPSFQALALSLPPLSMRSPTWDAMQKRTDQRFSDLRLGFAQEAGTIADRFGKLQEVVSGSVRLSSALDDAVSATRVRGGFGFDYRSFAGAAAAVSEILDDDPVLEARIEGPLEAVKDASSFDDELLMDFSEILGWWQALRSHRLSTAGLVLGYTSGLLRYVAGAASGDPSPSNVVESVALGGAIYFAIANRRLPPGEDEQD